MKSGYFQKVTGTTDLFFHDQISMIASDVEACFILQTNGGECPTKLNKKPKIWSINRVDIR